MTALVDQLDELGASPAVRALGAGVAARASVTPDLQSQYVSLRPALEGAVAVYLLRERISIALDPDRALQVPAVVPGVVLQKKTPRTTYVVADVPLLQKHAGVLTDLAVEAVEWRVHGPKHHASAGGAAASVREPGLLPHALDGAAAHRRLRVLRELSPACAARSQPAVQAASTRRTTSAVDPSRRRSEAASSRSTPSLSRSPRAGLRRLATSRGRARRERPTAGSRPGGALSTGACRRQKRAFLTPPSMHELRSVRSTRTRRSGRHGTAAGCDPRIR